MNGISAVAGLSVHLFTNPLGPWLNAGPAIVLLFVTLNVLILAGRGLPATLAKFAGLCGTVCLSGYLTVEPVTELTRHLFDQILAVWQV